MKGLKTVASILVLSVFFGCGEEKQQDELDPPSTEVIVEKTDTVKTEEQVKPVEKKKETDRKTELSFSKPEREFIATFDTLGFGRNFKDVKQAFPVVRGIKPEGGSDALASQGLTESEAMVKLLGRDAKIEFNFLKDSLYSYFVTFKVNDFNRAENLYEFIHNHYQKKYGECKKERVEEETKFTRTCFWPAPGERFVVLTYNVNAGLISWGHQAQKPM